MKKKYLFIMTLLLFTALLAGCYDYSGKETQTSPTKPVSSNSITIKNFSFQPSSIIITKGTTVTWIHQDTATHTVILSSGPENFASQTMNKGDSFDKTFSIAGTYEYYCSFHPSMKGTILIKE